MNRRAFLGLLGLAPVASCVPLTPVAAETAGRTVESIIVKLDEIPVLGPEGVTTWKPLDLIEAIRSDRHLVSSPLDYAEPLPRTSQNPEEHGSAL